jgi:membrane protein
VQSDEWRKYPGLVRDFCRLLWQQYKQDGCRETAAALTYTTLFAIVPVMTVTFTILRALPTMRDQGREIQGWLFSYFLPSADSQIQEHLQAFAQQAAHLTGIGILFLVVTSVLMLFTIEGAMNRIWKVRVPRKGITSLLMYWAVLSLGPLCLGVGLGISSYVTSVALFRETVNYFGLMHFLLVLVPVFFSACLLTLLYIVVPNCHVPVKKGIIGGLVAAILFELAKGAFVQFIKFSPSYQLVYGAFAAVPLFLLWIYISWMIVLGGAEFVRTLVVFRETRHRVPHLQALLRLLESLWLKQRSGAVLKPSEIRDTLARAGVERWDEFRNLLMELELMRRTEEGSYVLTRDLTRLTLAELLQLLPWPLHTQLCVAGRMRRPWEDSLKERCEAALASLGTLDISLAELFGQGPESEPSSD